MVKVETEGLKYGTLTKKQNSLRSIHRQNLYQHQITCSVLEAQQSKETLTVIPFSQTGAAPRLSGSKA